LGVYLHLFHVIVKASFRDNQRLIKYLARDNFLEVRLWLPSFAIQIYHLLRIKVVIFNMGRGGEQAAPRQASLNPEDTVILPPIPSQDDRSIDPPVSNLHYYCLIYTA